MLKSKFTHFLLLFFALPCFLYASHTAPADPPSNKRSYSIRDVLEFIEAIEEGFPYPDWSERYLSDMRLIIIRLAQMGCKEEDREKLNRDTLEYLGVPTIEYDPPSPFDYYMPDAQSEGFHQTGFFDSLEKGVKKVYKGVTAVNHAVGKAGKYVWDHKREAAIGVIIVTGAILAGVAITNQDDPPSVPGNPNLDSWYYPDSPNYDPNNPDSALPSFYEGRHEPEVTITPHLDQDVFSLSDQGLDIAATPDTNTIMTEEVQEIADRMGIDLPQESAPLNYDLQTSVTPDYGFSFLDPNQEYSSTALSYETMGQQALSDGLYDQAAHDFTQVIELAPGSLNPYIGRGLANFEAGNYDLSIQDFNTFSEKLAQEAGPYDSDIMAVAKEFGIGVADGLYDAGAGFLSFAGNCLCHPITTTTQVGTSFAKLVGLSLTAEWREISQMLVPEVCELVTNWGNLSVEERSHKMGHALAKNGGDILIPAASIKVASRASKGMRRLAATCNELKLANEMLVLEAAAEIGNATKVKNAVQSTITSRAKELGFNSIEIAQLESLSIPPNTISGEMLFTNHALKRAIERGVTKEAIYDAIQAPLKIEPVKIDHLGRPSQRFIGQYAEVAINPETQGIVSVNPTSAKKAEKLINGRSSTNAN